MRRSLRQLMPEVHFSAEASLAALGQTLAAERIAPVLAAFGLHTQRERKLPLSLVVVLIVAMRLFADSAIEDVLVKLLQGPSFLRPDGIELAASKGAISQRRQPVGVRPLVALCRTVCQPLATRQTSGAFLFGLRLMALDGTVEDVADTPANAAYFGYHNSRRGHSAFPQVDVLYLCESGTHAICDVGFWPHRGQAGLDARRLLRSVGPDMLLMADAGLQSYDLCAGCVQHGAHFLNRVSGRLKLLPIQRLPDGSYLAELRPSDYRRHKRGDHRLVRVIEYQLEDPGRAGHGQRRRLITSLLDNDQAPAQALACAYHERWEVELTIDEVDTHQRCPRHPLRSRTPLGVLQELYGLVLAHYAIRAVMHAAALRAGCDPDRLSFTKTLRLWRCAIFEAQIVAREQFELWYGRLLERIGRMRLPVRDNRCNPRVVRRKMSNFDLKRDKHRHVLQPTQSFAEAVVILGATLALPLSVCAQPAPI
jgi:hypothetical protein